MGDFRSFRLEWQFLFFSQPIATSYECLLVALRSLRGVKVIDNPKLHLFTKTKEKDIA